MTKSKKLVLLLGVLVVLIGVYALTVGLSSRSEMPDDAGDNDDRTDATDPFFTVDVETLCAFSYMVDGEIYRYTLSEDATRWLWDDDPTWPLSNGLITIMIQSVLSLNSEYRYENIATDDLEKYGLDQPINRLKFTGTDGSDTELLLGKTNSFNSMMYCCTSADMSTIYMIEPAIATNFTARPTDLVEDDELPTYQLSQFYGFKLLLGEEQYLCDYTYPTDDDVENTQKELLLYSDASDGLILDADERDRLIDAVMDLKLSDAVTFDPERYETYGVDDDTTRTLTIHYSETKKVTDSESGQTTSTEIKRVCTLLLGNETETGLTYVRMSDGAGVYRLDLAPILALSGR